jgi:hypothetical protein
MSQTINITLTDTQIKGLEYAALSPSEWIENAATERARVANDEIVQIYTTRALDEGVQIPTTREAIIADAFSRGWVKTFTARQEDIRAAAEAAFNEAQPS